MFTVAFLTVALVFYTGGVVLGFRRRWGWAGLTLAVGWLVDMGITTIVMIVGRGGSVDLPAWFMMGHRLAGALGLVGMLLLVVMTCIATRWQPSRIWFRPAAFVVYPIWLISYLSGMVVAVT